MGHPAAVWDHKTSLELTKDWNGIEQVVLRNPQGASARVSLHGGQVISWRNDRGEAHLFTSSKFGNCGSVDQHGFARNKIWTIEDDPPPLHASDSLGKSFVDLLLKPAEEDLKCWPHGRIISVGFLYFAVKDCALLTLKSFEFRLRVSLTSVGNLMLVSRIRNINGKPFSFSFGYHTHFSVSDISEVRIEGLETLDYLDNLCQKERFTEQGDAITFESEVDRVYLSSPQCVAVLDHERKRTYAMRKEGLPDIGNRYASILTEKKIYKYIMLKFF
ncbi:galactose mutarotase-like superfamily protein [Striga asiatica]|uniref:Galactose mutarotase-like superfamily protein n=1 Tax=Striga asiatica TaxID=4170 RepID=A0A5A7QZB4_STRAF|nr:galactose mutarotase-like superfamily protein [Striga asiatica]